MMRGTTIMLPFRGLWLARNSPARRVPSHGTDLFGTRYAIDFIAVDASRRSAPHRDWRTVLATEPPERFFGFGQPVLSPADGIVVAAHDGEVDHEARRSQLSLASYMLGQPARVRQGVPAIAGNHLVISLREHGVFAALVHLRAGSLLVGVGDAVRAGQPIAECGNSGNSTQPHVHMQLMDSEDFSVASGVPMTFWRFREWPRGSQGSTIREFGLPAEDSIVEPCEA
ncbi:MAG: M23 family metallopeptidase [Micromonosporaceae bacterium]|nr:M23 family metallopeptidase [Micromonosporaceae bacterium]